MVPWQVRWEPFAADANNLSSAFRYRQVHTHVYTLVYTHVVSHMSDIHNHTPVEKQSHVPTLFFVRVHAYTYAHIYMQMAICMSMHTSMPICDYKQYLPAHVGTYSHPQVCTCLCTCPYTYPCTCPCTCRCTCRHTHLCKTLHTCLHAHLCTWKCMSVHTSAKQGFLCAGNDPCLYTDSCAYLCTVLHIPTRVPMCMSVYMPTRANVCANALVPIQTWTHSDVIPIVLMLLGVANDMKTNEDCLTVSTHAHTRHCTLQHSATQHGTAGHHGRAPHRTAHHVQGSANMFVYMCVHLCARMSAHMCYTRLHMRLHTRLYRICLYVYSIHVQKHALKSLLACVTCATPAEKSMGYRLD